MFGIENGDMEFEPVDTSPGVGDGTVCRQNRGLKDATSSGQYCLCLQYTLACYCDWSLHVLGAPYCGTVRPDSLSTDWL